MQLSQIVPPQFRLHRPRYSAISRMHFGNRQLAQVVSLLVVAIVMIPIAFVIIRALSAGQEGIDYLLKARNLRIVGNSLA